MRTTFTILAGGMLLVIAGSALAEVHYVDVNSTNATPPYGSWSTAATNIQDAVDVAVAGDEIVVTNGTYRTGGGQVIDTFNRVAVNKPLSIRSVNGPQSTIISGSGSVRCVYLTNGASLSGFTLTNGFSVDVGGSGVACFSGNAVVSNCVITGNHVFVDLYEDVFSWLLRGGGAYGVTLNNCTLTSNSVNISDGFGVIANIVTAGGGGAAFCTLNNCTLSGNSANFFNYTPFNFYVPYVEGGAAINCTLNNCTLNSNSVTINQSRGYAYGGGASYCTLNNCTLTGNSARANAGFNAFGGGAYNSTLNNCTLICNSARDGGGASGGTLNNCIVYFNNALFGENHYSCRLNYSCTTPQPSGGGGNITNPPLFVDRASGNLRLQSNSPCINAGNNSYVTSATDLDGNPRIAGGTVDMGAYEFQAVRYVDVNSTNATPPYSSWATAATSIQDAVDAAVPGDEIVVTNGVYQTGARDVYGMSNRVAISKPVTVRSVNGPAVTSIVGYGPSGPAAVRCVYLTNGAVLSGFALTNGATQRSGDILTNQSGGGVWCESSIAVVSNCVLVRNAFAVNGGGAYSGTLINCTLTGNSAITGGGAAYSTLNNCTLSGNSLAFQGGGAAGCTLNNCTLVGNSANNGGGALGCSLNNCILFGNTQRGFCEDCGAGSLVGNNWFGDPVFVDTNGWANLRLQSNSPCINAGNNSYVTNATDLDGNPRIAGRTVDIGAFEFQAPASMISYAWLQQFNLPINPATDTADPDSDGVNNWQEWRCATDPTNALSALRLLAPAVVGSDLLLRWESVADRTYFLERSPAVSSAFTPLATGIPGQPGTNTYTDTNAIGAWPWFYRVGVSNP